MSSSNVSPLAPPTCSTCRLSALCLPGGLSEPDARNLGNLALPRRRVAKGQHLFLEGNTLHALYAIRLGSFKTYQGVPEGMEHVTGFAFSGDVLGFDGFASGLHAASARALEDSEVCAIPFSAIVGVGNDAYAPLRRRLHQMLGVELVRGQQLMGVLANTSADQRVAGFLLMVSRRMRERGFSPLEFVLRMSRAEMASYLGLTLATVSRSFTALADRELIEVRKRWVRLVDLSALTQSAGPAGPGMSREPAAVPVEAGREPIAA